MSDRLKELAERLVMSGGKCANVSCSETHELSDGVFEILEEKEQLEAENEKLRETLDKISRGNAMDYEYQRWAREAVGK